MSVVNGKVKLEHVMREKIKAKHATSHLSMLLGGRPVYTFDGCKGVVEDVGCQYQPHNDVHAIHIRYLLIGEDGLYETMSIKLEAGNPLIEYLAGDTL